MDKQNQHCSGEQRILRNLLFINNSYVCYVTYVMALVCEYTVYGAADTAVIQRCNDNPLRIIEMNPLVWENVSIIKGMQNRT